MVSTMLMTVSLLTLGMLAVQNAAREVTQAGHMVARERALLAAQAAVNFTAARLANMDNDTLSAMLAGTPSPDADSAVCPDLVPGPASGATLVAGPLTGQRRSDCAGYFCMRQGAVVRMDIDNNNELDTLCDTPLNDLVPNLDPEAFVTMYIRNDAGDVIGATPGADTSWTREENGTVVLTGHVRVRGAFLAVEQAIAVGGVVATPGSQMRSPDEGYGGGHNNDNSAVNICTESYEAVHLQ